MSKEVCGHDRRGPSCLRSQKLVLLFERVSLTGGRRRAAGEPASPPRILGAMQNDLRAKLSDELVDQLLAGASSEEEIVGPGAEPSIQERLPGPEATRAPGRRYAVLAPPLGATGWASLFEPKIVRKRRRPFEGFDQKILALYSRGFSVRHRPAHAREIYGVEVSTGLISQVTDAVVDDARSSQRRPLDDVCPLLFLNSFVAKIREAGASSAPRLLPRARGGDGRCHGACSGCGSRRTWVPGSDVGPDRAQAARRQRHRDLLRGRPQRVSPR